MINDAFDNFVYITYGTKPSEYCSKIEELRVAFKAGVEYGVNFDLMEDEIVEHNDGERK